MAIAGETYGRLTAIAVAPPSKRGLKKFRCLCSCGRGVVVYQSDLHRGHSRSCGCLKSDRCKERATHRQSKTRWYVVWKGIRARLNNPNHRSFSNYGGRDILLHAAWDDFETFKRDLLTEIGDRPSSSYTLDRIDNDGNYCPGNMRWANRIEQAHNSRSVKLIAWRGRLCCLSEIARETGIKQPTLWMRLARGLTIDQAVQSWR